MGSFFDQTVRDERDPAPAEVRPVRRSPSVLTVIGFLLLAAGLACLGWVGYQYVGTNIVSERSFSEQRTALRERWEAPQPPAGNGGDQNGGDQNGGDQNGGDRSGAPAVIPGEAMALLRVPAFGPDFEVPIVSGVDLSVLERGVGHYPSTAAPGEVGNFALAGHRVTHGQPFARLLELERGDEVVVETATAVFTYVVDLAPRELTVGDSETWVLDPVPRRPDDSPAPDVRPTEALLTLTTCQDLFSSPDRSIGFGHLTATVPKKA